MLLHRILIGIFMVVVATSVNAQETEHHIVLRGETFASIAKKYGITEQQLKNANSSRPICYAGLKLTIPAVSSVVSSVDNSKVQPKQPPKENMTTEMKKAKEQLELALESDNLKKVIKCLKKVAKLGDVDAQLGLGFFYSEGMDGREDLGEAVKWFRKAAEQGAVEAQSILAEIYYEGDDGVSKDLSEAVKWYRKAAEQGEVDAQFMLGHCYYYGEGVSKNENEGIKWIRMAADQGYEKAISFLKEIK